MSKQVRPKAAKSTDEPIEQLLDDGSPEFKELVQERLRELLIEQIISLRQKRGWSQAVLADRAGFKQPFIARLESGKFTNVELRTLARIADALDVSLEIRLTDKEPIPVRATP